ncbi:MAG: hypothetical protein KME46_23550 [Brasilonema angustatum HA4187-MV1]|jgi:hypothetical protein|nr:hypothetical protein [Brasilonema angustatum HA4187-MV1]
MSFAIDVGCRLHRWQSIKSLLAINSSVLVISRTTRRDLFEIRTKTAVSPQDIRTAIAQRADAARIAHFQGM